MIKAGIVALGLCLISQAPAASATGYTDEMVIKAVHLNASFDDMDDDLIITVAHAVCTERDDGATDDHIAGELIRDEHASRFDSMYFIGVAESAFCPEYNS